MRELSHDTLRYEGGAGETGTIRVAAVNTAHLVTFNIDGAGARPLAEGEDIVFRLKNQSGARTDVQIRLDFTGNGRYDLTVENVEDCELPASPAGECAQRCLGPDGGVMNFKFFAA